MASALVAQVEDGVLDLLHLLDLFSLLLQLLLLLADGLLLSLGQCLQAGTLLPKIITLKHELNYLRNFHLIQYQQIVSKTTRNKTNKRWFTPENLRILIFGQFIRQ